MSILLKIRVDDHGNPTIERLTRNAKEAKKHVEPLGDTLKRVFSSAALLVGVDRLVDGMRSLGTEAAKFELNMKRIQGIGNVTKGLDLMSKSVRDLAFSTEYSASQISSSMLDMVKAGFDDPAAVAKAMPNVINLATTAMMDLNYAAENSVDILRAFGLENEETARVANVMANSLNMTTMNAEDYFEAIKYVSSVSTAMNVSLEETSVMLGMLANAGIKGSQAGTSLRSILLNILQPNKAVAAGLRSMNLEGKSLTEVLVGLRKRGLTIIDFLKTFDKTAITSTMVLSNTSEKSRTAYMGLVDALESQSLSVQKTSDIVRTAYIPQLMQMKNMVGVLAIEFLSAFGSEPQKVLDDIKGKLTDAREWIENNKESIEKLAASVTKLVGILVDLSGSGLALVIKNMETLTKTVVVLVGIKALGGLPLALDRAKVSMIGLSSTVIGRFNLIAVAAGSVKMIVDTMIDNWNDKLDQMNKNNSDLSISGLKTQYDLYDKIYTAQVKMRDLEANKSVSEKNVETGKRNRAEYINTKKELEFLQKQLSSSYGVSLDSSTNEGFRRVMNERDNIQKSMYLLQRQGSSKNQNFLRGGANGNVPDLSNLDVQGASKPTKIKDDIFDLLGTSFAEQKKLSQDNKESLTEAYSWIIDQNRRANSGNYSLQGVKDSELSGSLPNVGIEAKDISKVSTQAGIDRKLNLSSEGAERIGEAVKSINDSMWSLGQTTSDVMSTLVDKRLEKTLAALETEKAAIQNRYDTEINAAGISAFKKEQLEQEKNQKLIALEQKMTVEKEKAARKQKAIDTAVATAKAAQAVIGVLAETTGGPIVRTAAALEIAAIAGTYLATMMAVNLRSGGYVSGSGNGTSDSVPANLSKGEYVVSSSDVNKAGGPRGVQTAIDRSVGYSRSSGSTITIGTIIGEETYVRTYLLPIIRKEQRR